MPLTDLIPSSESSLSDVLAKLGYAHRSTGLPSQRELLKDGAVHMRGDCLQVWDWLRANLMLETSRWTDYHDSTIFVQTREINAIRRKITHLNIGRERHALQAKLVDLVASRRARMDVIRLGDFQ